MSQVTKTAALIGDGSEENPYRPDLPAGTQMNVVSWNREAGTVTYTVPEALAKIDAAAKVAQKSARSMVVAEELDDDEVVDIAVLFPHWEEGLAVQAGWVYQWDGTLVECIQPHTTQSDWTPDVSASLWKIHRAPNDVAVFVQPTGAHDVYELGDLVLFPDANGDVYESVIDANAYSPTTYPAGWKLI